MCVCLIISKPEFPKWKPQMNQATQFFQVQEEQDWLRFWHFERL